MIDEAHNLLAAMARGNSTTVYAVPVFLSFMRKILEPNDFTFLVQRAFGELNLYSVVLDVQSVPHAKIAAIKALRAFTSAMADAGYDGYGGGMGLKEAKETTEGVARAQMLACKPAPLEVIESIAKASGLKDNFAYRTILAA